MRRSVLGWYLFQLSLQAGQFENLQIVMMCFVSSLLVTSRSWFDL